jgi:hypothetical protein
MTREDNCYSDTGQGPMGKEEKELTSNTDRKMNTKSWGNEGQEHSKHSKE